MIEEVSPGNGVATTAESNDMGDPVEDQVDVGHQLWHQAVGVGGQEAALQTVQRAFELTRRVPRGHLVDEIPMHLCVLQRLRKRFSRRLKQQYIVEYKGWKKRFSCSYGRALG